jgi:tripartite-type tricarboxylate transporter receptor subunit TctC
MMHSNGRRALLRTALVASSLAFAEARAQAYPARGVRVVVPFAAGGAIDVVARAVAESMNRASGQPFVVENRTGASGNLGVEAVVKAPADGYTLLVGPDTNFTVNPLIFPKLGFDPLEALVPVAQLARLVLVLAVHPDLPVRTLGEFLAYARQRPGAISCATPGAGTPHDLAIKALEQVAGVKITAIPYKGGAPAVADAVGGHVQAVVGGLNVIKPHAASGRLRMLVVMQSARSALEPTVPPAADDLPGLNVGSWLAMFAPAGTPAPALSWLRAEAVAALSRADIAQRLATQGIEPVTEQPSDLVALARAERARHRTLVEAGVIRAE